MDKQCLSLTCTIIKCIWLSHTWYNKFEDYIMHFKRVVKKMIFFAIWLIVYIHHTLNLWPQVHVTCEWNNHARKHIKLFIKLMYSFLYLWSFTKILVHNYICIWKILITIWIIIILIILIFTLKSIPYKFCVW